MSLYKENTKVGSNIYYNGTKLQNVYLNNTKVWSGRKTINATGFYFNASTAVNYNNEIHILGGRDSSYNEKNIHKKWNGSAWVNLTNLPANFSYSPAVEYNGKLYIIGGNESRSLCYAWNGSSWSSISTPYFCMLGCAVVYRNEIHVLGGVNGRTSHYSWNGSSWKSVSTLPVDCKYGPSAAVVNDKIYLMGGQNSQGTNSHVTYCWNGSSWSKICDDGSPYTKLLNYKNKLYWAGNYIGTSNTDRYLKILLNNSSYRSVVDETWGSGYDAVVADLGTGSEIFIFKGSSNAGEIFQYDGNELILNS